MMRAMKREILLAMLNELLLWKHLDREDEQVAKVIRGLMREFDHLQAEHDLKFNLNEMEN